MRSDVLGGHRVIAIIRLRSGNPVVRVARELAEAGIGALEVTLTTPDALAAVTSLRSILSGSGTAVGVGSVRTPVDATRAIEAGAQFVVTPTTRETVLASAAVPVVCGALTPTEIDVAWSFGAAYVKIFPADLVGPGYLRDVLAPLPDVPLVPTGGITPENLPEYAAAGAVAVGVGSALVSESTVDAEDWAELRSRALTFGRAAGSAPWTAR